MINLLDEYFEKTCYYFVTSENYKSKTVIQSKHARTYNVKMFVEVKCASAN